MFGGSWGALASGVENLVDKERSPPARPIPLEFPSYIPPRCESPLNQQHIKAVCQSLASIRRLTDIQDSHLGHLNVQIEQNVPLPNMVADRRLENRPLLYDAELTAMLTELEVDNEDAYREILRMPPLEGRTKPRLAHSRNFFASLEDMSRYWDNSKDNYYEVDVLETDAKREELKKTGTQTEDKVDSSDARVAKVTKIAQPLSQANGAASTKGSSGPSSTAPEVVEMPTRPKKKQVYKGQRFGNGEQMGAGTRVAAIRNLVKMAVHKFNCRDYDVSPREKFRIRNINVPAVSYNFCVAKLPADTKLLRSRMVEGPLMAVYCRNDVRFKSRQGLLGPSSDFLGEKFDFFREIGGMLLLANQRAREGQLPSQEPREDQWWAIKSRWGGGATKWGNLANEVFEEDDPSWSPDERRLQLEKREQEEAERRKAETAATADLKNLKPEDLMSGPLTPSSERPKKKKKSGEEGGISKTKAEYRDGRQLMYVPPLRRKWYQEWVKIRPNGPGCDDKIICRTVGKSGKGESDSGWDDIYMISSVNHHACVLKMSIHENYLEWLRSGKGGEAHEEATSTVNPASRQEHMLYVSRSSWCDLFDIGQRKELLTGIWRILSWLNRDEVPREEVEKLEELRRQQQDRNVPADVEMAL